MIFLFLDDNRPKVTEAEDDIPRNWWLNLVAIQSEVAQSRNTVIDRVVNSVNGDRADIGATYTCKNMKGVHVTKLTIPL